MGFCITECDREGIMEVVGRQGECWGEILKNPTRPIIMQSYELVFNEIRLFFPLEEKKVYIIWFFDFPLVVSNQMVVQLITPYTPNAYFPANLNTEDLD